MVFRRYSNGLKVLQKEVDLLHQLLAWGNICLVLPNYWQLVERNGLNTVFLFAVNLQASLHYNLIRQSFSKPILMKEPFKSFAVTTFHQDNKLDGYILVVGVVFLFTNIFY